MGEERYEGGFGGWKEAGWERMLRMLWMEEPPPPLPPLAVVGKEGSLGLRRSGILVDLDIGR